MSETPRTTNHQPVDSAGSPRARRRWLGLAHEDQLKGVGEEPDPRFSFANERTFLAWNRTALALIAGGLVAAQFLHFNLHGLRLLIAVPAIALGGALALASYRDWFESERAMRLGQPLPSSRMPQVLVAGIIVIAVFGAILVVIDRLVH